MDGFAENFNNRQALLPEKKKSGSDGAPSTMEAAADTWGVIESSSCI